jgi:hypothetical protein
MSAVLPLILALASATPLAPPPRNSPPQQQPAPAVEQVQPAPSTPLRPAQPLSAGGLSIPMGGLQSFAANGGFLKGLNAADARPQCRSRCGSDRGFCTSGGGDDGCDTAWRQCVAACRAP